MPTENRVAPAATDPKSQSMVAAKSASKPGPKRADPLPPAASPPTPAKAQPPAAPTSKAPTVGLPQATLQPAPVAVTQASAAPAIGAPSEPAPAPQPMLPAPAPVWSTQDESTFQAMLARRKAAGYQRRGKDVAGQMLKPGEITPNAGTVAATIIGLVAAAGTISRGDLLDAMAKTAFSHAKARPADRAWCQGYIAGTIRDRFLAEAGEPSPASISKGAEQ